MPGKRQKPSGAINPPRLPETAPIDALPDGALVDHGLYATMVLARAVLSGQGARHVTVEEVLLAHVRLDETRMPSAQIRDARFDTCDLAQGAWEQAHMARVELLECRLLGFKAPEARMQDVLVRRCNAQYAAFWGARCTAVRFEQCVLSEASFQDADLAGVVFDRCDLRRADLQGAKLAGADFRGCQVEGMRVDGADLRGAIIDASQAVAFVGLLGLVVKNA